MLAFFPFPYFRYYRIRCNQLLRVAGNLEYEYLENRSIENTA